MKETVMCLECGLDFKVITNTHLKTHDMTLRQYREKYPNAYLLAEKVYADVLKAQRKGADSLRGLERPDYVKDKIRNTVSKTVGDPKWRKEQSDRMYQHYEDHPETIEKFKGPRPSICGDKNPSKRPEVRKKISEAISGECNGMWQGGISFEPYCSEFNEKLKRRIRNLYNNCDFMSGLPDHTCNILNGKSQSLAVHYVDYDKTQGCNDVKWKLVPLSRSNHAKVHSNRMFWERLFCYTLDYDETYYDYEIKDICKLGG